ncbi:MAG: C1 family peptidase [Bacteroidota bacterium]
MAQEKTAPKTTQPEAKSLRSKPAAKTTAEKLNKTFDAAPDKVDIRDWFYHPTLKPLPHQLINCDEVPQILDQGKEGACTGFALAAVINFHLVKNKCCTAKGIKGKDGVSPKMLYDMARRYDEWPGQNYEGSSARGTMKGWSAHGVVRRWMWEDWQKDHVEQTSGQVKKMQLDESRAKAALEVPVGAFYRVMHTEVRDMHAALNETGILYATLMVHDGWLQPSGKPIEYKHGSKGETKAFPVIERTHDADGVHAIAIVGYTKDGFIIQNSWGEDWGAGGFALLPYEDWTLHAADCWTVQLGVPLQINLSDLKNKNNRGEGAQKASSIIPLHDIKPYIINIGNNGFLSDSGDYWTTENDIDTLFESIANTAQNNNWKKKRIMLYLHGGLNSEREVARRAISFKQVCLDNQIYPVHIMWETDFWNSMKNNVLDIFTNEDKATANFLNKLRDAAVELKDRTIELTTAKAGTLLWDEMKENARLASTGHASREGQERAMIVLAQKGLQAFNQLPDAEKKNWEIHIVAHSAGAIFLAYALETLLGIGIPIKTIQLMAPAVSVDLFKEKYIPQITKNPELLPTIYLLSDKGERDDDVGPYGKSLLYLVSNAFERRRERPILGMEKFINPNNKDLDKSFIDPQVSKLLKGTNVNGWPHIVVAGAAAADLKLGPDISRSETHGGFDNDSFTLNSVLYRILGKKAGREFGPGDLMW